MQVQFKVYSTRELGLVEVYDRFGATGASHCDLFLAAEFLHIILGKKEHIPRKSEEA